MKKYIAHSDFIVDLINSSNIQTVISNSYRKLIHCVWIGENTDSTRISFDELGKKTQNFRHVSGSYKHMLSYSDNVMEEINWKNVGFEYNCETKAYYPIIISDTFLPTKNNTVINNTKILTQIQIKAAKTEDQLTALNKQF